MQQYKCSPKARGTGLPVVNLAETSRYITARNGYWIGHVQLPNHRANLHSIIIA